MTATRKRRRLSSGEKAQIIARQNNCCAICGRELVGTIHMDHRIPFELWGADDADNIQAVHVACHQTKTRGDMKAIAKAKRLERFMETGRHRNRKSRPIQSRGFDKSLRKRMDGTVERRRA